MTNIDNSDLSPYFSYGSNTNTEEFYQRTKHHLPRPTCVAMLPDRELAFTHHSVGRNGGVLDVRPKLGSVVHGAVHWIPKALEAVIDRKEGSKYVKRYGWVYTLDGKRLRVFFYEVRDEFRQELVCPAAAYLAAVAQGYKKVDLSPLPLMAAAEGKPCSSPMRLLATGPLAIGGRLSFHIDFLGAGRSVPMEFFGESYDWNGEILVKIRSRRRNLVEADGVILQDESASLQRLDQLMGALPGDSQKAGIYRTPLLVGTVERGRIYDTWCYAWWERMPVGASRIKCEVAAPELTISKEFGLVH